MKNKMDKFKDILKRKPPVHIATNELTVFTKKEWLRIELAIRVDTSKNKSDAKLLANIQKKINLLIDLME